VKEAAGELEEDGAADEDRGPEEGERLAGAEQVVRVVGAVGERGVEVVGGGGGERVEGGGDGGHGGGEDAGDDESGEPGR